MMASHILTVSIDRPPAEVYAFASLPENMPAWVTSFVKSVTKSEDGWRMETSEGVFGLRFAPENEFGVLDHYVSLPNGDEVYVPLRVVANGGGSEVLFTLFRTPDMTDEQLARDTAMVQADLATLKQVLEAS